MSWTTPKTTSRVSFGPKAEFWSRLGPRGRLYGNVGVDYQYFQEYDSQRSFGTSDVVRLDYDLGRLTPFAEGAYTNTRIRPGYEIDTQGPSGRRVGARRREYSRAVQDASCSRGYARSSSAMTTARSSSTTDLSRALDRDSTYYGGGMQVELTPLTTFLIDVEVGQDRFVRSPERDADTWKVMPGFRFKPFALIDGSWPSATGTSTPSARSCRTTAA